MKALAPHEADPNWFLLAKLLFGVALVIGAPFLVKPTISKYNEARQSANWPQTEAEITQSEVKTGQNRAKPAWTPVVSYRYSVDGKNYTSSDIAFRSFETPIPSHAEEVVEKYPVGSKHPVFYSPEDHSKAVLEKGTNWLVILALFFPLLFLAWGGYITYDNFIFLRARLSQPKNKKKKKRTQTSNTSSPNSALKRRRRRIRKNQDGG
ncbi:hypothetical protein Pan153_36650 [Gimesia panareensis]|uniref:DUF3592 domain-containing protein n=1 Tax=Gimesia panareensis TaxID=2527978 RepID=A0A518FRP6_9PLAN|nr:DUF3592 domain-containing protein [Gimesia panareensis]QDV19004.1 hypothetical protein Pan153_36650 [Gimesia panareensis]